MDEVNEARPAQKFRRWPVAIGMVGVLGLAGVGVAAAQSDDSPTPAKEPATTAVPAEPGPGWAEAGPGDRIFLRGPGGPGGPGGPHGGPMFEKRIGAFGFGGIHGENTTKDPDGDGFRTTAHQFGEVTDLSASKITVKSEDGFSRTYDVTEDSLVNAGRDGIGDVKKGDQVRVMALVEGDKATAMHVTDETNLGKIGEKWWPKPNGKK